MTAARILSIAAVFAAASPATELYSWHGFDYAETLHPKLELQITSRLRTRDEFKFLQQVRGGPVLRWRVSEKNVLYGGYYLQPGHDPSAPWRMGQRLFIGLERPWNFKKFTISNRIAAEHHFTGGARANYNRYRTSTRLFFPGRRITPFVQSEWLAVRQGFHSTRSSGGLRVRLNAMMTMEASYLYDIRRTVWGGDRSAIVTSITFRRAEK
ncbi:MAG: DUF2490 domain-containing protein [Bryobacterales bacterium]|nr:DUF2490 domain-containing protein [Bryobacterales bacterium]